jgi:pimeloyl-ACP methyl ester carboxylesterase
VSGGLERQVKARDGRMLACLEVGDPVGPLVLHNHGGPSSRLEARLFDDAAARHRLRFVCVDRPGIGQSSPHEGRSFASWAEDLTMVADHLGCGRFAVTGWSEGGPWALAAAAFIDPVRLAHVASVAGGSYGAFGDNWAAPWLGRADALGGFLALHMEPGFRLMYAALGFTADHMRKGYIRALAKAVNESDRALLSSPGVETAFSGMSAECFAHGSDGLVRDAQLLYRAWAFDVTKITRAVHLWQGTDDRLVPAVINRTIAQRMPGAVWHEVEGAGHFVALGSVDAILGAAARDLEARPAT